MQWKNSLTEKLNIYIKNSLYISYFNVILLTHLRFSISIQNAVGCNITLGQIAITQITSTSDVLFEEQSQDNNTKYTHHL